MGRQAKRKKRRHQSPESEAQTPTDPTINRQQFVRDFTHRGYSMQDIARSPELPDTRPKPEL
ncbi:MAG: hypothetical protein F6J87_09030 [Spirulina sp. SIO3F2]|nr:hypothetical protein [Spirulina sp. SIO3F2]